MHDLTDLCRVDKDLGQLLNPRRTLQQCVPLQQLCLSRISPLRSTDSWYLVSPSTHQSQS